MVQDFNFGPKLVWDGTVRPSPLRVKNCKSATKVDV